MENRTERVLFGQLLCPCGDCARLPLSTCTCSDADELRDVIRGKLGGGSSSASILSWYETTYGSEHLATPPSRGFAKTVWVFPAAVGASGAVLVFFLVKRWRRPPPPPPAAGAASPGAPSDDSYVRRLEQELRDDE